jgi:hypothetical protein
MLRLRNVQVDVPGDRYDEVVGFWTAALAATTFPSPGPSTHLVGPRATFGVHLQRLDDGPATYHLDLEADDVDAEVARVLGLGAAMGPDEGAGRTLYDPAGTAFCVVTAGAGSERIADRDPTHAYLDAIVLDVPEPLEQATATFWAAALGVAPFERQRPGDPYLWSEGLRSTVGTFDLGVQRLPADEPVRVHLDTICDEVEEEVARLRGLGGQLVAEFPRWRVLADPGGNLLCVVDSSGSAAAGG